MFSFFIGNIDDGVERTLSHHPSQLPHVIAEGIEVTGLVQGHIVVTGGGMCSIRNRPHCRACAKAPM